MKKNLLIVIITLLALPAFTQNFGINTKDPRVALEVNGSVLASNQNFIIKKPSDGPVPEYLISDGSIFTDSTGYLYDDGGLASNYLPNQDYSIMITPENADLIAIKVKSFQTESQHDSLRILNAENGNVIATLHGNETGIFLVCGTAEITFHSNATMQDSGFVILWQGLYAQTNERFINDFGPGGRLEYVALKNALRAGFIENDQWHFENIGSNSFATGKNVIASGNQSAAFGLGTKTDRDNTMVLGRFNDPQPNSILEVGNGSDENARSNAFVIYEDGQQNAKGPLEISTNSTLAKPHIKLHEEGNDYARINFDNENGDNYWTIASYIANNSRNDRLNFWNGATGDLLSLTGDGRLGLNVGISPKTTFHVGNGKRVLFGIDTLGNGDKLMFLPDLHAFRVGTIATGAASTYWNRDSIGLYSFASGLNTRAQGFGATAMGRDTEATNSYAFASGFFTNADGQYSTAMGFNTDAFALGSTALGYSTDAEANYSFAAGYFAEAQAIYSIAIGNAVSAQSYASMAVGRYNIGGGNSDSWVSSDPIFEIGNGTGPSAKSNAMTVLKNGNSGFGTETPDATLQVIGTTRLGTVEEITDGGSHLLDFDATLRPSTNNERSLGNSDKRWRSVYATNGTINTSDVRNKENIENLTYGLKEILQLRPVKFSWKDQPTEGKKIGLIAQELKEIISEVVVDTDWRTDEETGEKHEVSVENMGVYYSDLIPVLIKSTQELAQNNAILKEALQEQKLLISQLNKRVQELENN